MHAQRGSLHFACTLLRYTVQCETISDIKLIINLHDSIINELRLCINLVRRIIPGGVLSIGPPCTSLVWMPVSQYFHFGAVAILHCYLFRLLLRKSLRACEPIDVQLQTK